MGLFLNSNAASINAQRNLFNVSNDLNKSLERLSSGFKINKASDGAANLVLSEDLRGQIRGTDAAISNVQQGVSILNTADGGLQQISGLLQRARELAVSASNGTVTDFTAFNDEYQEIRTAIDAVSTNTQFNGNVLLDGSLSGAAFNIQTGPDSGDTINIAAAFADGGISGAVGTALATAAITNTTTASALIGNVDSAITALGTLISDVGGFGTQLANQLDGLTITKENLVSAEASIRNTDIAQETSNLTRLQVTQQAAASALSQANQLPSIALRLLN
ncbi:MAG: hypothetical protein KTR14_08785 [Vampirovibrio sp.]|nr:hypothetical protein [Vampirovibrio sp.]